MLDNSDSEVSHISDMPDQRLPSITILRSACMVLGALRALRLSEASGHIVPHLSDCAFFRTFAEIFSR